MQRSRTLAGDDAADEEPIFAANGHLLDRLWAQGQDFGTRAKRALSKACFGRSVRLETHGQDKHGRMIGEVFIDGQSANRQLVRDGKRGGGLARGTASFFAFRLAKPSDFS